MKKYGPADIHICARWNKTWQKIRGKAFHANSESRILHGVGNTAAPSRLQNWLRFESMHSQGMPLAVAAISAARNSPPTSTAKHWITPYKIPIPEKTSANAWHMRF